MDFLIKLIQPNKRLTKEAIAFKDVCRGLWDWAEPKAAEWQSTKALTPFPGLANRAPPPETRSPCETPITAPEEGVLPPQAPAGDRRHALHADP